VNPNSIYEDWGANVIGKGVNEKVGGYVAVGKGI